MAFYFDPQTSLAIDIIKNSKNIVAFCGAGLSTESGIPDFRSVGGLWSQYDPAKYADYNVFLKNPEHYWPVVELHLIHGQLQLAHCRRA